MRDFVSSQGAEAAQRPMLTIVYDPDAPWANAGPDPSNVTWSGSPITLDGSGSRDLQGGNDATLAYSRKVTSAAYGSALAGVPAGSTRVSSFTPDRAGEREFELTVRNEVGATTVSPGETLHSGADLASADRGTARVFLRTLLPQSKNIRKVGGRGIKAFWVNGSQYDYHWSATEPQPRPTNDFEDEPYGEWRLELEPCRHDPALRGRGT